MSSVMKNHAGPVVRRMASSEQDRRHRRHDRWAVAVVLALMVVLLALLMWLANMGGTVHEGIDYWPTLP
jgi:hypothetical protein